jgi:hypothetical protein
MSGAYKHGLRAPLQTQEEAFNQGDVFINTKLTEAVNHQLDWDDLQGSANTYSGLAIYAFGEALHTVTDRESPWHDNGNEIWWGIALPGASLGHALGERYLGHSQQGSIAEAEYQAKLLWARFQMMLDDARKKKAQEEEKERKLKGQKDNPGGPQT